MHNVIFLPSLFVRRGPRGLPDVPAVRVLGGEHPLLAGLRGPQEGAESGADRGEGGLIWIQVTYQITELITISLIKPLQARIIYEDYVSILSPREVSLDSRVREIINRNMIAPSQGRRRSSAHCGGGGARNRPSDEDNSLGGLNWRNQILRE